MRKHRLFGVVIAVLVGLGVFTHPSSTPQRTPGTERAGSQTIGPVGAGVPVPSAELTVERVAAAGVPAPTGAITPASNDDLLHLVEASADVVETTSFGMQGIDRDYRAGEAHEQAVVDSYLSVVAQERAAVKAYLTAMAPPKPAPARAVSVRPSSGDAFARLRQCESGGNYGANTGNGYYGAYQFTLGSWASQGLKGLPSQASPAQQDQAARALEARRGWGQWPACARRLGLL